MPSYVERRCIKLAWWNL